MTNTHKWKTPFYRSLPAAYKLLWSYMRDDCDFTGVWMVDFEVARVLVDPSVELAAALRYFDSQIVVIDRYTWWLPDFFFDNYGRDQNSTNRVFLKAIEHLKAFGINPFNTPSTPRQRPVNGAVDIDIGKDIDIENKKESKKKSKQPKAEVVLPFQSPEFAEKWGQWLAYKAERRESYKGPIGQQAVLKRIAKWGEARAIEAIDYSMSRTWAGIFEDDSKTQIHGTTGKKPNANQTHIHDLASSFAARHGTPRAGAGPDPGQPVGG